MGVFSLPYRIYVNMGRGTTRSGADSIGENDNRVQSKDYVCLIEKAYNGYCYTILNVHIQFEKNEYVLQHKLNIAFD